jgi:hypothetical protein
MTLCQQSDALDSFIETTMGGGEKREKHNIGPMPRYDALRRYEAKNMTIMGTLICRDGEDLYHLLYAICIRSILCREIYYLDESKERNFRKFMSQLSLIKLFHHSQMDGGGGEEGVEGELFVSQIWPQEWCPYYAVQYLANATTNCSQTGPPTLTFVYAVMDMMMTYKQYISNEHYCNDHNERLLWDGYTFRCICRHGRSCHNDARTNAYIALLVIMVIGLFLLLIAMTFYTTTTFFV